MRAILIATLCLTALFGMARPADAYLDANTGNLILQLLVGGIAGVALAGKIFWHRLKGFFGFSSAERDDS